MNHLARRSLVLLALALALGAAPARAGAFALIVTNNRSLDLERPDLHYADDDGAKWAELFGDLLGPERVTLLTELDDDSRALFPGLAARLPPPTHAALEAAVARLGQSLAADPDPDVVYLVFAGHGDLADGEGFLELADRRFTATDLEALVARLHGARVHLVLDACNAYFMLHPRKPGGARYAARVPAADLLTRHPEVGALVSTSAEAIAWEWSEIQSGIFSHLVRSALRGAADADRDGAITYRELEGYLAIAQADLENAEYRPRIFARPPAAAATEPFARLPTTSPFGRRVAVALPSARRFTLRDARGLRILDAHIAPGAPLTLVLPTADLEVEEVLAATPRPLRATLALPAAATELPAAAAPDGTGTAGRGEAPVFRRLFTSPFGPDALERWALAPRDAEPTYGVSRRDAERLGHMLTTAAAYERNSRASSAVVNGGLGVGLVIGTAALNKDSTAGVALALFTGVGGVVSLVDCGLDIFVTEDVEDLAAAFAKEDVSSEDRRAHAVARYEALLREEAQDAKHARWRRGIFHTLLGLGAVTYASLLLANGGEREVVTAIFAGFGAGYLASGVYETFAGSSSLEDLWHLYQRERQLPWEPGHGPTLVPALAPIDHGLVLGVAGTF